MKNHILVFTCNNTYVIGVSKALLRYIVESDVKSINDMSFLGVKLTLNWGIDARVGGTLFKKALGVDGCDGVSNYRFMPLALLGKPLNSYLEPRRKYLKMLVDKMEHQKY